VNDIVSAFQNEFKDEEFRVNFLRLNQIWSRNGP